MVTIMSINLHRPIGIISEYIKCIWSLEDTNKDTLGCPVRLIPTECVELYFYLGDPGTWKQGRVVFQIKNGFEFIGAGFPALFF
jgi:hypothetical protein